MTEAIQWYNGRDYVDVSSTSPLPVTASVTATAAQKSTAAAPSYIEGSTNPLSGDLAGNLRTTLVTAIPAGAAIVGKVGIDQTTPGTTNAVSVASASGTRIEGTIAAGATAQAVFGATPANGFEIINVHASENLYIRESASAATVADNSFNTAIVPGGSYMSPPGYKPVTDVSIIATTTSHAYIARRW